MAPIMNVRTDGLLACFHDKSFKKAIQGGPATKRRTPLSRAESRPYPEG